MYQDKPEQYFNLVRHDIAPLLPAHAKRVLEIGCGSGATLAWLKQAQLAEWTAGIELCEDAASVARGRVDEVYQGDVMAELSHFESASLDVILCLDVLEHLLDPWQVLQALQSRLHPDGCLIISLPNIRHYSVLLPLLFQGRWQYQTAGIMDKTHLRFFSHQTALDLVQQAGLALTQECSTYAWGTWDKWKNKATLGLWHEFFSFQYLMRLEPHHVD